MKAVFIWLYIVGTKIHEINYPSNDISIITKITHKEGGAHHRISVWHLLINLKNNFLSKKLLKWANKKYKYFNIYKNLKNHKKNKEKHLE